MRATCGRTWCFDHRVRTPRIRQLALYAVLSVALVPAGARGDGGSDGGSPAELSLTPGLRTLLQKGTFTRTPKVFRIIALSHLADGCAEEGLASSDPAMRDAGRRCVARALELALGAQPSKGKVADEPQGLWLSHFNLILGASDRVIGSCVKPALHEAVTRALVARSQSAAHLHIASYRERKERWPADQAATLASIARYDRAHGEALVRPLAEAWTKWLSAQATDPSSDLPWSEITGSGKGGRHPRGSANGFLVRYIAEVDPALAQRWWAAHQQAFL
jgi:hypothetical protein